MARSLAVTILRSQNWQESIELNFSMIKFCLSSADHNSENTRCNMDRKEAAHPPSHSPEILTGINTWQIRPRELHLPLVSAGFGRRNEPHLRIDQEYCGLCSPFHLDRELSLCLISSPPIIIYSVCWKIVLTLAMSPTFNAPQFMESLLSPKELSLCVGEIWIKVWQVIQWMRWLLNCWSRITPQTCTHAVGME